MYLVSPFGFFGAVRDMERLSQKKRGGGRNSRGKASGVEIWVWSWEVCVEGGSGAEDVILGGGFSSVLGCGSVCWKHVCGREGGMGRGEGGTGDARRKAGDGMFGIFKRGECFEERVGRVWRGFGEVEGTVH